MLNSKNSIALILTLAFMIMTCFCACDKKTIDDENVEDVGDFSIHTNLSENIFFERLSSTENSIFIAKSEKTDESNRQYIIKNQLVFRFAYDNQGYVAYHWNELDFDIVDESDLRNVNNVTYEIKNDFFTVYDISNEIYNDFKTHADFLVFCKKNQLNFEWSYSNGFKIKELAVTEGKDIWRVCAFDSESLCGYVLKNDEVVYEGYIDDVDLQDGVLSFRLQVPHKSKLEFNQLTFDGLNVRFDETVGKKKISALLLYEDIYYDEYIYIDTQNSVVTVENR